VTDDDTDRVVTFMDDAEWFAGEMAAERFAAELDGDAAQEPAALDAVMLAECATAFVKMAVSQHIGEKPLGPNGAGMLRVIRRWCNAGPAKLDLADLKAARETVTNMTASLLEDGALTGIE
jgi:hypothetical protein